MDIFKTLLIHNPPNLALEGQVSYQGTWDASANSPTLVSGIGTKGYYYVVSTSGSTNLDGVTTWTVGDWAIFNGTAWQKVDNTDAVNSVFGRTGAVVGVSTDYSSVGITNTAIGASNPSTGAFTTLSATLTVSGEVTGPTTTDLTLRGGSAGASLLLGQGTNGGFTFTPAGTGFVKLNTQATTALQISGDANGSSIISGNTALTGPKLLTLQGSNIVFSIGGVGEVGRFTTTSGNLLIGGTTDISGSGGLKVFGTTDANSTISGALQVLGGVGVAKSAWFGGTVYAGSGTSKAYIASDGSNVGYLGTTTGAFPVEIRPNQTTVARFTTTGNLLVGTTTDMSGSGGLTVTGTAVASNFLLGTGGPSVSSTLNARASRQGLLFDGTGQLTTFTSTAIGATGFTVSAVVNATTLGSSGRVIINGSSFEFGVLQTGVVYVYNGATALSSTGTVTAGKLTSVAYTKSGSTGTFYINGVAAGTVTDALTYGSAIGVGGTNATSGMLGAILAPVLYNRALSAAEVLSLYEAGAPAQADYPAQFAGTALLTGNNSNFATGVGTWQQVNGAAIAASGGVLNVTGSSAYIGAGTENGLVRLGARYRLTFTSASYTGTVANVMVFLQNGDTFGAYPAGTHTVEFTATVTSYVGFSATGGTSGTFTLDNVTLVPLGVTLAPDANQPGGGLAWYDTSGNSRTITLPASGVSWNIPSSRYLGGNWTTAGNLNAAGGFYVSSAAISPNGTACIDMSFQGTFGKISAINRGVNNFPLVLNQEGAAILIGTTTNSNNGVLQLTTHNFVGGGIGFGADTSLYRDSQGKLRIESVGGGTVSGYAFYINNVSKGQCLIFNDNLYLDSNTAGASLIFRSGATTTALTIDGSQNATFAQSVAITGKTTFGFASSSRGTATIDANYGLVLRGYTGAIADLTFTQDGGSIFMRNAVGTSNVFFNGLVKVGMTGTIDSRLHVYESTAVDVSNGVTIEQAGTGDAVASFLLSGVQRWSVGIDNSDSDKFKIGTGTLGSVDRLAIDISGNAVLAGSLTATGGVRGTATNDNAAAGNVGEFASVDVAYASRVALTSGTAANAVSLSLTAGDWDVEFNPIFTQTTAGTILGLLGGVSSTSATLPSSAGERGHSPSGPNGNSDFSLRAPTRRISLSATTTIYGVVTANFSSGAFSVYGFMRARRTR